MTEIMKRETRNRGERRPVAPPELTPRIATSAASKSTKSLKRKSPEPSTNVTLATPESRDPSWLPSTTAKPSKDLPDAEFESVAESGILAASLKQSMERWRDGGCFEKYWVRNPAKKIYKEANFVNPPAQSMNKLGEAELTIEPHIFKVTLFNVRPVVPKPVPQLPKSVLPQIPPYKTPTKLLPTFPQLAGEDGGKPRTVVAAPETVSRKTIEVPASSKPVSASQTPTASRPSTSSTQSATDSTNTNPVIKELARRAAADPKLKELMKVVAAGTAEEKTLKEFQRHIDDINAMLKGATPKLAKVQQKKEMPVIAPKPNESKALHSQPAISSSKQESRPPHPSETVSKSKAPPITLPDFPAVVFEIANGTGDRYLIPRKSLLEYHDGDRMAIMSFLVHLKGGSANGGIYHNEEQYCELITFKLRTDRSAILEPLQRAVDPPHVVRQNMEEWTKQMKIAEKAFLVLRKARQTSDETRPTTLIQVVVEDNTATQYGAPDFLFALKRSKVA